MLFTARISRTNIHADEVNRLQLRNLTPAQRKNINKQNKIKTDDVAARMLHDAEKILAKLTNSSKLTIQDRERKEKEDIQTLINGALRILFNELENVNLSHEQKIKALGEKLKKVFGEVRRIKAKYRGSK